MRFGCRQGIGHPAISQEDDGSIQVRALCLSGKPFTTVTFQSSHPPNTTANSVFLQGPRYGMPEVRRMSDYSSDAMAFLDLQEGGTDVGLVIPSYGTVGDDDDDSGAFSYCTADSIDKAVDNANQTLVALESHIQSMGFALDRLFITNYWMSKQYTFFADLNSWLTGSNTQLGKQIARVEDWILSMYQSLAFQLEYKTMMAKISVGNEFTEITGMKLKKKSK